MVLLFRLYYGSEFASRVMDAWAYRHGIQFASSFDQASRSNERCRIRLRQPCGGVAHDQRYHWRAPSYWSRHVSYARVPSPHQRLHLTTRGPNPQVASGLDSLGGLILDTPIDSGGLISGSATAATKNCYLAVLVLSIDLLD